MNRLKYLYVFAWICYVAFSIVTFPKLQNFIGIPGIGLVGLGGWIYGRTIGLLINLYYLIFKFFICNILHPEVIHYYEDRLAGTVLMIIVVCLADASKQSQANLKSAKQQLEKSIAARNQELNQLADQLIARIEHTRINLGEELHDGIGQELTGIQLYSCTLADQLVDLKNASASLGYSLRARAARIHDQIRTAARTLFPVKLEEIGLPAALDELVSCLTEIHRIDCSIQGHDALNGTAPAEAIQIYRICQESALYVLNHSDASRIDILIHPAERTHLIRIQHNGGRIEFGDQDDFDASIILYRLNQLRGGMPKHTPTDNNVLEYTIPAATL
jgi:glucose-6-phosphate-specific signal transduction histidine kinase